MSKVKTTKGASAKGSPSVNVSGRGRGRRASVSGSVRRQSRGGNTTASSGRLAVYTELILTEKKYVEDLSALVGVWLEPLFATGKLSENEVALVRSNVEFLRDFHAQFLREMAPDAKPSAKILNAFEKNAKVFSMYSVFCEGYDRAIEIVADAQQRYKAVKEVLADASAKSAGLDFNSYYIKIPQRICKYPLFFRELQKNTPKSESRKLHDRISKIKAEVERVSDSVNAKLAAAEQHREVLKIYQTLASSHSVSEHDLAFFVGDASRRWIGEWPVQVKAQDRNNKWKRHRFLLFSDSVVLGRANTQARLSIAGDPKRVYAKDILYFAHMNSLVVMVESGEEFSLNVTDANGSRYSNYVFKCDGNNAYSALVDARAAHDKVSKDRVRAGEQSRTALGIHAERRGLKLEPKVRQTKASMLRHKMNAADIPGTRKGEGASPFPIKKKTKKKKKKVMQ